MSAPMQPKRRTIKRIAWALAATFVIGLMGTPDVRLDAHPGNVRRSDCTHVDRRTGERHRHTGRPYCSQHFLSPAWMHH